MPKPVLTARVEESQLEALERITQERGLKNVGELVRKWLDNQIAQSDIDLSLEALYELRERIVKRIAEREAQRVEEIKARRKPPDLVIVQIEGVGIKVERADAVKAGLTFKELRTGKAKRNA